MKTILVPTDYSDIAINATEYAIEIAKLTDARIILLHVFDVPVTVTDIPVLINTFEDFEKIKREQLIQHEKEIIAKYGKTINIKSILKPGFVIDEIKDVVKEENVELIVMGITGAGRITELLMGSNVSRVIKTIPCPTITVPENIRFHSIKKIAFACDYNDLEESPALVELQKIIKLFDASLLMINIVDPAEKPSYKKVLSTSLLEHVFEEMHPTVAFQKNEDIIQGINHFVDINNVDMLIMVPKKHNALYRLFHESNTKKMAFHTHIPLLTIPQLI